VLGGRQGAAWKRRKCLTGGVPAGLDAPCSRRGSNQRMGLGEDEEAAGQICKAIAFASLLPHVTTDHPCALSGSTRFSAGGFVLVSVKG
jgi:hypothetical protein